MSGNNSQDIANLLTAALSSYVTQEEINREFPNEEDEVMIVVDDEDEEEIIVDDGDEEEIVVDDSEGEDDLIAVDDEVEDEIVYFDSDDEEMLFLEDDIDDVQELEEPDDVNDFNIIDEDFVEGADEEVEYDLSEWFSNNEHVKTTWKTTIQWDDKVKEKENGAYVGTSRTSTFRQQQKRKIELKSNRSIMDYGVHGLDVNKGMHL
ncbi:unnamed protein product [Mucor hiemalis]